MTDTDHVHDLLRQVDCFAALDDDLLDLLQSKLRLQSYAPKDVICTEGEPAGWMFIVDQGEVDVLKTTEDGAQVKIATLHAGDFGGMQSLLDRQPRSASLVAASDVRLWVLDHGTFEHLLEESAPLVMGMLSFMSRRMRHDTQNLAATLRYVDVAGAKRVYEECSPEERLILDTINAKVAGAENLDDIMNFLFEATRKISPCDRLCLAFFEDDNTRVTSKWVRADYEPVLLGVGYSEDLQGSSLEAVMESGQPRVINDLEAYLGEHPHSRSTKAIVAEGIRSSMTCPLVVDGRPVGLLFRSSRQPNAYDDHEVTMHLAVAARLSQAVEKAYRIEQLTAANNAYFETLGFVSHELRSPLAALVMDSHVLTNGYVGELNEKQAAQVGKMVRKAEYLMGLIEEYINLSHIESGELEGRFQGGVDFIAEVAEPACSIIESQIEAKRMHFEKVLPEAPMAVGCDPMLLKIVMVNLLSNACKYGDEEGAVRLTVLHNEWGFKVSVWNTGPGFPEAQRPKLFRKFSRLDTPELNKRKGSGIGLYTTRRIIQLHGGRIDAESQEGAWAEFRFAIPQPLSCA